jgi:hypothetical protein
MRLCLTSLDSPKGVCPKGVCGCTLPDVTGLCCPQCMAGLEAGLLCAGASWLAAALQRQVLPGTPAAA